LHPSYNNGDPGNTVAAAEAWNAEHDEIVQERESEAAYQAYLQQLEDSRPDESAEFPFPPHEDA
jgi:hypothetical protein